MTETTFKNKKPNTTELLSFGFAESGGCYTYSADLACGQLSMTVTVSKDGKVYTEVIDTADGEEYVLHRVPDAGGTFVGQVKTEYEALLEQISNQCFDSDVFQSEAARQVITYVREKYGDELEFLWQKFPDNAVCRRRDTGKWYAALLTVSKQKLGLDFPESVEILDLRIKPEDIETLVDHRTYFPGYHMNKKHWYTVCLDGSIPSEELFRRIDASYALAGGQKGGRS